MSKKLSEEELGKVAGGVNSSGVQIYLKDEPLDMDKKISQLIEEHEEFKSIVSSYPVISMVKNRTLNQICPSLITAEALQNAIDQATNYTR